MIDLCWNPTNVFKAARNRKCNSKQFDFINFPVIKNQWARDDPAFVFMLGLFMLVVALSYAFCFENISFWSYIYLMLWFFFVDFLLTGHKLWITDNNKSRFVSNKYLRNNTSSEQVEWLYAFDIHCNAFFILFITLYLGQYILMPILISYNTFSLILSNLLYSGAFSYYFYITFRGFVELQNINNPECFLYPIGAIIFGLMLSGLFGFHCTRFVIALYFG
ncbi:5 TM domain-containing transmembrane protein [Acrasis kona]|uniref:5 TM domain-containing transmembrane protein n=1 Tax=Acrasis kona TaxID=1008807 RepID=A0AAW2ZCC9_9EUKA